MKDSSGAEVALTCYTGGHADCFGYTYYGSIFGKGTECECQCHQARNKGTRMSERKELPVVESASARAFETIYRFTDGRIAAVHKDDDVQEYADRWNAIAEYEEEAGQVRVMSEFFRSIEPTSEAHETSAPATDKTFTDAELMAEYWAAHLREDMRGLMTGNPRLRFSQRHTLRRFATTPSYSEDDE